MKAQGFDWKGLLHSRVSEIINIMWFFKSDVKLPLQ